MSQRAHHHIIYIKGPASRHKGAQCQNALLVTIYYYPLLHHGILADSHDGYYGVLYWHHCVLAVRLIANKP
jgi:hypothetical protein